MASNMPAKSRRDFEADLVARAWKDAQFKGRLTSNPKAVVEAEMNKYGGATLPADTKVSLLEESPKQLYLVIPRSPAQRTQALSDEQLESVAGGTVVVVVGVAVVLVFP